MSPGMEAGGVNRDLPERGRSFFVLFYEKKLSNNDAIQRILLHSHKKMKQHDTI